MLMMMRADDDYTPATRGCTAEELLACVTSDDYDACIAACSDAEEGEEEDLPGYAKVSGKAETSQSVALNAVDKKIGTVTLKAGENDTTVTNIEITKAGLGARTDIDKIQLMKNGEYVTVNGGLNSNNVAKLRFKPNLVLKANSSETFDVVVSMAGSGTAQAGGQHEFSVTSVTVANGTFDGTPVKLGSLTTTNYEVAEATVTVGGATLKAGETNKEITKVTVSSPKDATLKSITLTATNTNNEDLFDVISDVKAYIDGKVAGTVSVNEESIVISNLDTKIEKNDSVDVVVKGTDVFVGSGFAMTLAADTGHVTIFEDNTNERMNSTYASNTLTIQGVDLKITNNVTSAQTASINEKNVVLLDMTVTSSNEIDITDFYVKFPLTGAAFTGVFADEEGVTLYVDGIDYTINTSKLGNTGIVTYTNEDFTVSSSNSIRVQIKGTPKAQATITNIEFGITSVKNVNDKTSFSAGSNLKKTSHKTTVKGGNVTVSKATTPSANTIEMGTEQDVLFFKVKSPSEDVRLTGFALVITGTDSLNVLSGRASTPITNIAIYEEGETSPIVDFDFEDMTDWDKTGNTVTTGITLDDFSDFTVTAGDTVNFVVKATFDNEVVADLGDKYQVALTDVYGQGVTSKTGINAGTLSVAGTNYTVVTDKPDVELVKNGKFINVTVKNDSSYDVKFQNSGVVAAKGLLSIELERLATSNDNYLLDTQGLTVEVLDAENGTSIGSGSYANGVITVEFDDDFVVDSSAEKSFTIKLISANSNAISSDSYNVSKKSADFNYYDVDTTTTSKYINVKY